MSSLKIFFYGLGDNYHVRHEWKDVLEAISHVPACYSVRITVVVGCVQVHIG